TLAKPARWAWWMTNSAWAWLSRAGSVLGMHATLVTPPATAAAVPVAMVSSSSPPGSRRWTWRSVPPGVAAPPRGSRVRAGRRAGVGGAGGPAAGLRADAHHAGVGEPEVGDLVEVLRRVDDAAVGDAEGGHAGDCTAGGRRRAS